MKNKSEKIPPVLIVGMARSGTTLVSHILGSLPNVHAEIEPHALWKSGNFNFLNDEEYTISNKIVNRIRKKLTANLKGQTLIEKSPINCLRPNLVHAVFPDAKIVYIERDPVRCIYSNYSRSLKKDSFKFSIILKKYFNKTGTDDLAGAISERKLHQQLALSDVPAFARFILKMLYWRQVSGTLPFGPKLKNFIEIIKQKGLLYYHAEVWKAAEKYKEVYKKLYGNNIGFFKMETIMNDIDEVYRLISFAGIDCNKARVEQIFASFDKEKVDSAVKTNNVDKQIESLIYSPIEHKEALEKFK